VLFELLWLFIILYYTWPSAGVRGGQNLAQPVKPPRQRSRESKPFAGLTYEPHCTVCVRDVGVAQAAVADSAAQAQEAEHLQRVAARWCAWAVAAEAASLQSGWQEKPEQMAALRCAWWWGSACLSATLLNKSPGSRGQQPRRPRPEAVLSMPRRD
jgi:hypothetical protein